MWETKVQAPGLHQAKSFYHQDILMVLIPFLSLKQKFHFSSIRKLPPKTVALRPIVDVQGSCSFSIFHSRNGLLESSQPT